MASSIGNILKITIFGASHSEAIGMTVEGLPAGVKIDKENIEKTLLKRHPHDDISTPRHEPDKVDFLCGVLENHTTGTPLTFIIHNQDVDSSKYVRGQIRPGHADLVYYQKYGGFNDFRGGGFSSGRITASIVVLGAICRQILYKKKIRIGTHISSIHGVQDRNFDWKNIEKDIESLDNIKFPVLDENQGKKMIEEIRNAKAKSNSVGGILESVVINCPIGLGEPYFDSLESYISQLFFSVGGIKGVLFGDGMDLANHYGSETNDQLRYNTKGKIEYLSNHNGGITGGLSNGEPIVVKSIVKPTASILCPQQSINISKQKNINLELQGRHDPCIVHRVRVILDSLLAFAILDMMMMKESKNIWVFTDLLAKK